MPEQGNEYKIQQIIFGEEWIEVVFMETRHIHKQMVKIQTQLIRPNKYPGRINSLLEEIEDLLDHALADERLEGSRPAPAEDDY